METNEGLLLRAAPILTSLGLALLAALGFRLQRHVTAAVFAGAAIARMVGYLEWLDGWVRFFIPE